MDITQIMKRSLLDLWPMELWNESTVIVAVSGGADSVALLNIIHSLRPEPARTIVAHYNHGLRGKESDEDQRFVESLAVELGFGFVMERALQGGKANCSENRLRGLRHRFLESVAVNHSARWIAMAHHADDQVETFLHHLLRGSGPMGLSGIPARRPVSSLTDVVRPLLRTQRSQILGFLAERGQPFRTDASNLDSNYTRNRIRNELLPLLRAFDGSGNLDQRLRQASELIGEEHAVVKDLADRWLAKVGFLESSLNETGFSVPLPMCRNEPWPVVRKALVVVWHQRDWPLREMSAKHWRQLKRLIEIASQTNHPKRLELPGHVQATCRRGTLRIARSNSTD